MSSKHKKTILILIIGLNIYLFIVILIIVYQYINTTKYNQISHLTTNLNLIVID